MPRFHYSKTNKYKDVIERAMGNSDRYIQEMVSGLPSGDWSKDINPEVWVTDSLNPSDVGAGSPHTSTGYYQSRPGYITLNPDVGNEDAFIGNLIHELAHSVQRRYNPKLTEQEYEDFAEEMRKRVRR